MHVRWETVAFALAARFCMRAGLGDGIPMSWLGKDSSFALSSLIITGVAVDNMHSVLLEIQAVPL